MSGVAEGLLDRVTWQFPGLCEMLGRTAEAVSKVAIELGARGTLQTMTMAAMTLDEFVNSLKK